MKRGKPATSLRWQMTVMMLGAWLVPVVLVLAVMGWYIADSLSVRTARSLNDQFEVTVRMCVDRLNTAVEASRLATYSPDITDAWQRYRRNDAYGDLYWDTRAFLNRQYRYDSRFRFTVLWFSDEPDRRGLSTITEASGEGYAQVNRYWADDHQAVKDFAATLDTAVGFLPRGEQLYLVRNLKSSAYESIGTLVIALDSSYYFNDLAAYPWCSNLTVTLNGGSIVPVKGEAIFPGDFKLNAVTLGILWGGENSAFYQSLAGKGYTFSALAQVDGKSLLSQFSGYLWLLFSMLFLLLPLLGLVFRFFRRHISQPVAAMMAGAREIEAGKLGYQMDYRSDSLEFQYLTDSFNHMSGQLRHQFDRLYQEELALRDARIKALQAHINPHFLNNTLEIINWEARMNGNVKVSKMIEDLSTVLDAAIDRHKRPEVRLWEEMTYVNAYLHIIMERFGKRLTVTVDIPQVLMDCMVPRLILQPVIENAVEHGIGPGGCGNITLRGRQSGEFLLLDIENDGGLAPADEARIARLLSPEYESGRESERNVGISNVNQRLRILYGPPCGLTITCGEGERVLARITIALHGE